MAHRRELSFPLLLLALLVGIGTSAGAQQVVPDDPWCDEGEGGSGSERYCEVRDFSLDARDLVRVDAEPNGGIQVEAWDRNEISLRAKVQAWSRRGDPQEIAGNVRIETGNTITADGPGMERNEGWSASFRLMVPRSTNLDLESMNGGISIVGVRGEMDFSTMNGGITLDDVGGYVRGETRNGGLNVRLSGDQWDGRELDLRTTNGGVTLMVPGGFRADLETGTVNGSFDTEFPITVRGRLRSNRISTQLNGGGPPIHISTTNGSVRIRAR
jgi:DUF4097 and DUF4098 domain-containing protein YvlB